MIRKWLTGAAALMTASHATAQPLETVWDISEALGANQVGVDIAVQQPGSRWLTGGLFALASNGSEFVYAQDPNDGADFTAPAQWTTSRAVTFVSKPRGQEVAKRFGFNGEPFILGGYIDGLARGLPTEVDIGFYNSPNDPIEPLDEAGFISRVVVDITGAGVSKSSVYVNPTGHDPAAPDHILITHGQSGVGTNTHPSALDPPNIVLWSIWAVPEPQSLALLCLAFLTVRRRQ